MPLNKGTRPNLSSFTNIIMGHDGKLILLFFIIKYFGSYFEIALPDPHYELYRDMVASER